MKFAGKMLMSYLQRWLGKIATSAAIKYRLSTDVAAYIVSTAMNLVSEAITQNRASSVGSRSPTDGGNVAPAMGLSFLQRDTSSKNTR